MKSRIILSVVMLLAVLTTRAQEPVETKIFPTNQIIAPHKVEVTFSKTVHILFPSEVKYVDLGSFDIIADKATGAENVVRIKAAVKGFEGETNFSVITADGCFYSFNVVYADEPAQLSIEMEDWLNRNPMGGAVNDRMFVKLKELGGETPLVVNRIMYTLYKKNKRDIKHIGSKKYGIQTLLKGLYINNDLLYLHTVLRNYSDVSFDIDYVRFKVIDKKVAKRTAMQENNIEPVRTFNRLTTIDGKTTVRNVFVLPKLTLPDDKVLVVEFYEKGGARHQSFRIENTDLVAAKTINELHLK
ncbi:conjugative transposon protein TraN [Bacteroides reticulotermitis]|uniref:conjugative transposon protein TraN n=1 Tax=Bacteroides reticulotermitis TaxID=1133319 RepID=UPI003A86C388